MVYPVASQDKIKHGQKEWTGKPVIYIDTARKEHDALINRVWNVDDEGKPNYINLVYVVLDENKTDNYGQQIDRATSVPILSDATSAGRCFKYNSV